MLVKQILLFFITQKEKDNIPIMLTKLQINNQLIERVNSITLLSVLLDECLSWNSLFLHTAELFKSRKILSAFKLNVYYIAIFMCKVN